MKNRKAIFILNLLQDVNVLRSLVYLASVDLKLSTELIITEGFSKRDTMNIWRKEISEIVKDTCSLTFWVKDDFESYKILEGKSGILFAGSESDLSAHAPTHNLLKMASSHFLTVTLQHGFECVGFLQSVQHIIAHGKNITFAADVVCGWSDLEKLSTMADSQKNKLVVTGPSSVLQLPTKQRKKSYGIVCENLHSVRLSASGDMKVGFMDMFDNFCQQLNKRNTKVALRPHPGGQYVIKNNVKLAKNVIINNNPMYKVDLSEFAYGVSAPSSVVIDMILAEIPVAVWRDSAGIIDTDNYFGLAQVSTVGDLLEFEQDAIRNPTKYLSRQRDFIVRSGLKVDPEFVYGQYRGLIEAGTKTAVLEAAKNEQIDESETEKVVFIANDYIPTLQLSFIKPLAKQVENNELEFELITEKEMREAFPKAVDGAMSCQLLQTRLEKFKPTIIVFCRYSGPNAVFIRQWAKQNKIPVIFHIDDDLLHVPASLGPAKFKTHNSPNRVNTVRYLLDNSDLVYCSTQPLAERFASLLVNSPIHVAGFYCSGSIIAPAENRPIRKIGYMGFDHAHDLNTMVEAIEHTLKNNTDLIFEMFGTIPKPQILEKFGSRVVMREPVRDYKLFLKTFASLGWDIGICPLSVDKFNLLKANTKWVEYSSIGAAVVATKDTVYDTCVSDNCGILVSTLDEWINALERLVADPSLRFDLVNKAQSKLNNSFSVDQLNQQVLNVFEIAKELIVGAKDDQKI